MNDITFITVSCNPEKLRSLLEHVRRSGLFKEVLAVADAYNPSAEKTYAVAKELADRAWCWPVIGVAESVLEPLSAQVKTEWTLRLDDDERMGSNLPALLTRALSLPFVRVFGFPRYNLWPDPTHYIASHPWFPDDQLRLYRRHGVSYSGAVNSVIPTSSPSLIDSGIFHYKALWWTFKQRVQQAKRYHELGATRWNDYALLPEKYKNYGSDLLVRECPEGVL